MLEVILTLSQIKGRIHKKTVANKLRFPNTETIDTNIHLCPKHLLGKIYKPSSKHWAECELM